jgi:predicted aspartyl protease
MKNKRSAEFVIAVSLLYSTAAGVCQSLQGQPEIRFRLVHGTMVLLSLMANNQGPFDFVLDTGADITVVDPSLAGRLSMVSLRHTQQSTLAGDQTLPVSVMATLSAGPAHVDNLPVMIQDLSELRKRVPQIEGIVGQNFLSHFNYLLDYRRRSLRIEQDNEIRTAIDGNPLPMETRDNRMIVATEVQSGGLRKLRLILDSGASSIVLMRRASQALDLLAQTRRVAVTSSGPVELQMGTIQSLVVGSQQLRDIAVALTGIEVEERIGDGLLPMALFQVLYVNNREGFVVLNPRRRKK